jgi:redox-sensitive bicupin YhaK (pirin superfamily)
VSVDIRRSSSRFVEQEPGRRTQHGLSFGAHYDPDWLAFGPLVCHDDHLLGSGRGFDEHAHADLEIVTTVVSGSLVHADSHGTTAVLSAGDVAILSAGAGVRHSEHASADGPARFVQVWLRPDETGTAPSYARGASEAEPGAGLVPVAGAGTDLPIGVAGTSYAVARLAPGESVVLPAAPRLHAYVASGALLRSSLAEPLQAGDAYCFVDEADHEVTASVDTELLVWTFS